MNLAAKITYGICALVIAGLVGLVLAPEVILAAAPLEPSDSDSSLYGDDAAVGAAVPTGAVDYDGAQEAWTATVAVWPLPVPEAHPFPETIPLSSLNESGQYEGTVAAERANLWWECAAATSVIETVAADDLAAAKEWLRALAWWAASDTFALTLEDDGSYPTDLQAAAVDGSVPPRVSAIAEGCADLPGFGAVPIATP